MNRRRLAASVLAIACFVATATLMPYVGKAQTDKVQASMAALTSKTAQLGAPKIEGTDAVAEKDVPALYFGTTKMNNSSDLVDEIAKENGGVATLFVKSGDDYVRVATNVKKDDGSRAVGTVLDPKGPAYAKISRDEAFYGDATILGKPYDRLRTDQGRFGASAFTSSDLRSSRYWPRARTCTPPCPGVPLLVELPLRLLAQPITPPCAPSGPCSHTRPAHLLNPPGAERKWSCPQPALTRVTSDASGSYCRLM